MGYVIKNAKSLRNGKLEKCNLLIRKDKIKSFSYYDIRTRSDDEVINAEGLLLMPGVIDAHVHLREPGFTQKEDFETGSMAAAAGGVTTVFDMPNTKPPVFTTKILEEKRKLAQKMIVNYGFYFGSQPNNISEIKKAKGVCATKVFMNETTGKHIVSNDSDLENIFRASKRVAVHAEGLQVKRAIHFASKTRKKLYCCHISTAKELSLIAEAKRKRKKVFCEVTPHHLFLSHDDDTSGFTKMKPPLRSKDNVDSLWHGINSGLVDTIGTDHAPHTIAEKKELIPPYGVPGLETSLPLMMTAVRDGKLSYERLIELMCVNPAKIFRVKSRGKLRRSYFADITLVDIENEKKVSGSNMKSKAKWTPFEGRMLTGWPQYTFVNGKLIFDRGKINKIPAREVQFR